MTLRPTATPATPCGRIQRRTFLADAGMGFTGLALGAMLGTVISHAAPALTHALDFALPALFLALSLDNLNRETAAPLLAGAGAALGAVWVGNIALAMAAGVAAAVAVAAWRHRSAAS